MCSSELILLIAPTWRLTPKAFANSSLGQRPRVPHCGILKNAEGVRPRLALHLANAFSVLGLHDSPLLGRCPRLELANAFGVSSLLIPQVYDCRFNRRLNAPTRPSNRFNGFAVGLHEKPLKRLGQILRAASVHPVETGCE
jgi:hypothetical protein